jgi:hypothetical protein
MAVLSGIKEKLINSSFSIAGALQYSLESNKSL